MLGPRSQQGHTAVPRTSLGRIRTQPTPHPRRARHLGQRRLRPRVGHAHQGSNIRPLGPLCYRRRRQMPGFRPTGDHRVHGLDGPVRRLFVPLCIVYLVVSLWDLAAGKTMVTLTHHKKSVRALAIHPTEYSFASGSAGGNNIKKWKCPEGAFVFNFAGHNAIINTLSVNAEGVFFSGGTWYVMCVGGNADAPV